MVFGTLGIPKTLISFGLGLTLRMKNDFKCFVWYKNQTKLQHRQFSTSHNSWKYLSNQTETSCYKNGLKFNILNPLSAKLIKWPNTVKQFVGNLMTNFLSVFGHFLGLVLKGLSFWFKKIFGFLIAENCCSQNFYHAKNKFFYWSFFKSLEILFACLNRLLVCIVSVAIVLLWDNYFFDKIKVQCTFFSFNLIKTGSIQLLYDTKY